MKLRNKLNNIMENEKYRQGRSKEQEEASYLGASASIIGLIITGFLAIIFS